MATSAGPMGALVSSSAKPSRSPAPRPLRLLDLPVSHTSSTSTSPVSSVEYAPSTAHSGSAFGSDINTLVWSSASEFHAAEDHLDDRRTTIPLPSPSPSSLRRTFSGRDTSRRQSSISYFSPTRERDDSTPRSPLAGPPLSRSNSLAARPKSITSAEGVKAKRASIGSPAALDKVEERGPLTLVEKHVDLLQFIAQKEAKCMDLRTQLAAHEAELAQLKRKWERIVNRGLERTHTAALPAADPSSGNPSAPRGSSDMLEGLREGVQGVGRLLVAGLADLSSVSSPLSSGTPGSSPAAHFQLKSVDTTPLPPSAQRRGDVAVRVLQHAPTLSMSSTATSSSGASKSTRFSQSSASSLESATADGQCEDDGDLLAGGSISSAFHDARSEREAKLARRKSRDAAPTYTSGASPGSASATPSLPSASSIPLANIARDAQPVADWVKRKLDAPGAAAGRTVASANKRASGFFADVGQTLRAALAAPPTPTSLPSTPALASRKSLLDDDEDEAEAWAALTAGPVLVPDASPASPAAVLQPSSAATLGASKSPKSQDGFDDWNW